ncbi:MAG: mechanosensitive ion channel family protein [Vicinamibacterales bacterium]|jgi:small conductance mechanosensitive channel|nr:mechanosensitive ion channel family protein [Vicinamibacterales bacterium]
MTEDVASQLSTLVNTYLVPFGWKLLGAIAVWVIGGWIVRLVRAALGRFLVARHVDATLIRYLDAGANVLMRLLVLIGVLSVLGIETTSFAALIAALGIAIGAAWAGLLSNFAAGIFLMVLRPFKVGDFIQGGGVVGTVREINLFVTAVDTPDNVRTVVGNAKLFSDNIQNFSTNPFRRVELTAQVAHSVKPADAIQRLSARVATIPNVLANPAPSVEILTFNPMGTVIAVRPFCHTDHYWQVYFDTNKAIADVGAEANYPAPETRHLVRNS